VRKLVGYVPIITPPHPLSPLVLLHHVKPTTQTGVEIRGGWGFKWVDFKLIGTN